MAIVIVINLPSKGKNLQANGNAVQLDCNGPSIVVEQAKKNNDQPEAGDLENLNFKGSRERENVRPQSCRAIWSFLSKDRPSLFYLVPM